MHILVPVKRAVDYNVTIRVKSDQSGVETANVKMSMNPFDEIAVEEAIRLKEAGIATKITVVSLGIAKCEETLRTALAMGADEAILVETEAELHSLTVAKLLVTIVERTSPHLVIMGKQAIDSDCNQTGQMLAALLGWPQATFASNVEVKGEEVEVTREIDGGLQTLALRLPAVITTDLRLNEPRFVKLPDIMKARSKPLEKLSAEDTGVDLQPRITVQKVEAPTERTAGEKLENAALLVETLKTRGVL